MAMGFASTALATDWLFEPNVGATATYTDNANQSEDDPQSALILTVTPGFSLTSEGSRRVKASLRYGLRGVARFGEEQSTDLNHNLSARGNAELIEDFLFIDGSARISQELISLFGSPADADVNDSNRATVGTYSVSPYIQKRLGTFADAQARYSTGGAIFGKNVAADSTVNSFTAGLTSGTQFNDLSWGLHYSLRKTQNRNGPSAVGNIDTTFESARATAGYMLTRQFRVFGSVGEEWNDYPSAVSIDGSSYSVGFGWSPTRRTSVEVSAGERYFGKTFSFSGSHRTRMSRWTMRYAEDVSDISQTLFGLSDRTYWACLEGGRFKPYDTEFYPDPPAGICSTTPVTATDLYLLGVTAEELLAVGGITTSIANGIFISKSFTTGVSWDVGRLGFGLSARDTRRLYQMLGNAEDHVQGVTGSVSYRMSPKTTASSTLSFTRTSADALLVGGTADRADDLVSLSLGLNHRFAEKLRGALTFRHTQRDSNAANSDYDENSITASVNMGF
jgi:uncharacterized protein (PEP-CTERM system associated)